jgi:hypothetical protein
MDGWWLNIPEVKIGNFGCFSPKPAGIGEKRLVVI